MTEHALSWEAETHTVTNEDGFTVATRPTGMGTCSCLCGWESKRATVADASSFREQGNAHIEPFLAPRLERSRKTRDAMGDYRIFDGSYWLPFKTRTEYGIRYLDGRQHWNPLSGPEDQARAVEEDPSLTAIRRTVYVGPEWVVGHE